MRRRKVMVIGGGWYGCHIAAELLDAGHDVTLHEAGDRLFAGASGNNPARLHLGPHYPRSAVTREACRAHVPLFLEKYGDLTRCVPVNLYAVAETESLVDFGTYRKIMQGEVDFIEVDDPAEYGLRGCEGAILVKERHIVVNDARAHFENRLAGATVLDSIDPDWAGADFVFDCTFCARDAVRIDRYEPCLTVLLQGPTDKAVTVMDGPFPGIYPWDESRELLSLSSAKWTPMAKDIRTYQAAQAMLDEVPAITMKARAIEMREQMAAFYPAAALFDIVECRTAVRAMPRSAADSRVVDFVQVGNRVHRVRAGKIDAVIAAGLRALEICNE